MNSQGRTLRSSAKVYPTGAQAPPTSREPHPPTTKAPPTPRLAPPLPRLPGSKRACWRSQHRAIPGQLCPAPLGGFSCCPCSGRGPSATCPPRKAQARRQLEVRDSWESVAPQNLRFRAAPRAPTPAGRREKPNPRQGKATASRPRVSLAKGPVRQGRAGSRQPIDRPGELPRGEGKRRRRNLRAFSTTRGFACHKSAKFGGLGLGRSLRPG